MISPYTPEEIVKMLNVNDLNVCDVIPPSQLPPDFISQSRVKLLGCPIYVNTFGDFPNLHDAPEKLRSLSE